MITIFFSLFLILTVITIIGIESANLHANQTISSLQQSFGLPKLEYYSFLNIMSQITSLNPSNTTTAIFNSTIDNIYRSLFLNLNITGQGAATNSLVINNFAESVPLLVVNTQDSPTPNPFQQMVNVSLAPLLNYISTSPFGQNVEFTYENGSVIPSWLESYNSKYAVWWIKIPAISAEGTMTVYIKFASKTTNLFNANTVGEAPQLSPTYAQYDNGADVFNYYQRFGGLSALPSGWTTIYQNGNSNGLGFDSAYVYIPTGSTADSNQGITTTSNYDVKNQVLDVAASFGYSTSTSDATLDLGLGIASSLSTYFIGGGGGLISGGNTNGAAMSYYNNGISGKLQLFIGNSNPYNIAYLNSLNIYSIGMDSTHTFFYYNNILMYAGNSVPGTFSLPISVGTQEAIPMDIYYINMRMLPPNGVMPSVQLLDIPSQIGYTVPVKITNNQNSATSNPFAQEVVVNSSRYRIFEAGNLQNVEFFYPNGTIVPSWLESGNMSSQDTVYWLKIGSIPPNSSMYLYMGFASPNTNLFNGRTVGEAPQLSPTYAQYDNGADVFEFYDNFKGTSINTSKWALFSAGTNTITINDGLNIQAPSGSAGYYFLYSKNQFGQGTIAETDFSYSGPFSENIGSLNPGFSYTQSTSIDPSAQTQNTTAWSINSAGVGYWVAVQGNNGGAVNTPVTYVYSTGNNGDQSPSIWGVSYTGGINLWEWHNYDSFTLSSSGAQTNGGMYAGVGYESYNYPNTGLTTAINFNFQWFRARQYPPNGVMPSTSLGSLQNISSIYPFYYQYSVANFTNASTASVPGTASTAKIWNGGHAYTLAMWVNLQHSYGACGFPCSDLFQTNQGCTSGLQQDRDNATGYQINLLEWNSSCGTGATAQSSPYQYVPYGKWELITGIFQYNSQGNAWIASCVDTHCTNSTWTLTAPAVYSTPATILASNQLNGKIADVQMYDSALSLKQVNQLYQGFIGAPPVNDSSLVAWLPLDGNANDYSGNGNTGSLTSITFLYP